PSFAAWRNSSWHKIGQFEQLDSHLTRTRRNSLSKTISAITLMFFNLTTFAMIAREKNCESLESKGPILSSLGHHVGAVELGTLYATPA
ncbi:MAG: hypothetical protein AABZ47_18785, partial [Planctomycetota bacterium]